jgi:hypothetical protein
VPQGFVQKFREVYASGDKLDPGVLELVGKAIVLDHVQNQLQKHQDTLLMRTTLFEPDQQRVLQQRRQELIELLCGGSVIPIDNVAFALRSPMTPRR